MSCDWHWEDMRPGWAFLEFCLEPIVDWCKKKQNGTKQNKSQSFTPTETKASGEERHLMFQWTQNNITPSWIHLEPTLERWLSLVCLFRLKRKKNSIWKAKVALALMITSPSHNMKGTNQSLGTDRRTHTHILFCTHVHTHTHTKPLPWTDYILQEDLIKEFLMRLLLALPRTVLIFALHNA